MRPIFASFLTFSILLQSAFSQVPPQVIAPQAAPPPQTAAPAQTPPPAAAPKPAAPPAAAPAPAPAPAPQTPPPQQAPAPQQTPPPKQTASPPPPAVSTGNLNLNNASLTEVIDALCRTLRINYILDPRVKGAVTLNTYGETRQIDARNLLDLLLRLNGATMVQVGEFYRIVPLGDVGRMPLKPLVVADPKQVPEDDQTVLNLIFLKYATVTEVSKLIEPFIGEGARVVQYPAANLLFVMDSRRSIRRTMEIISLFDSDTLASQRVRLFEVKNGAPSAIAKEVDDVMKSISLSDKAVVRFLPIDRINTIVAIAPNPGAFDEVEKWIKKLDTEVKTTVGTLDNYVYRVKYGRAEILASVIMSLYGGYGYGMGMMGMMGMMSGMMGGAGMGGMGMGGYGMGGMGMGGMGMGGYGMGGMGMGGYGMGGMGMGGYGYGMGMGGTGMGYMPQGGYGYPGAGQMGYMGPGGYAPQYPTSGGTGTGTGGTGTGTGTGGTGTGTDQTGQYMSGGFYGGRMPRLIPNPMDNTLLIQATQQEYQQIMKLMRDIDIPPRQVLIDAKIYEVSLTGAFASGVSAYLQKLGSVKDGPGRAVVGSLADGAVQLSAGALVGRSRELLAFLSLAENESRAKVLSAPSVIATDSLAASINVGTDVPTLASQAVTPIQSGGNSLFANTIQNRSTGVTLNVMARVSPSGIVTLVINQDVSAPQAPTSGSIQSPSFSRRSINTQVTVQDGDTIAVGGIINESSAMSTSGIPILHRLPVIGSAFGSRSYNHDRTELIVFMTPRVIYDTNQIVEASDELRSRLRRLNKVVKD